MEQQILASFRDEIGKIAEIDPELAQLQQQSLQSAPKHWNDETTKQFLMDTGLIAAGTGLGYGAGKLTLRALKSIDVPPGIGTMLQYAAPLAGGIGAVAVRNMMRSEAQQRMAEAERRSLPQRTAV